MIFKFYLLILFSFLVKTQTYINQIEIGEEEKKLMIANKSVKVDNQIEKKFVLKSEKNPEIIQNEKYNEFQEKLQNLYFEGENWIKINNLLKLAKKENIINLSISDLLRQQRNLVIVSKIIEKMVNLVEFKKGCEKIQKDIENIKFDLLNEESQLFMKKFDNCEINLFDEDDAKDIPEWNPDLDFETSDYEKSENHKNDQKENLETEEL